MGTKTPIIKETEETRITPKPISVPIVPDPVSPVSPDPIKIPEKEPVTVG